MAQEQVQADYRIKIDRPKDIETGRDWVSRVISVALSSAFIVIAPTMLVGFWGSMIDFTTAGFTIGFTIGVIALAIIVPRRMIVYNQEWCGYVTQSLGGGMVPYGPGPHASHWWEQRNVDGNYSLEVKTQPFEANVVTPTGKVTISGQYEYAIDLGFIGQAIGVSADVVKKGITAFIEGYLTSTYDEMPAKDVKNKIDEMREKLSNELMNPNGRLALIRSQYGHKTVSIAVDKIALQQAAQDTRAAIDEAGVLFEVVANLYGHSVTELKELIANDTIKKPEYQKMLTRAMAVSNNQTTLDVRVIEGLEGVPEGRVGAAIDAMKGGKK
ncbi:MAG: hypothetical protein Q8O94_02275 [bacterium]|nr:hypothetical protein [bacterium]